MGKGILESTPELLAELFKFPKGTDVLDVVTTPSDRMNGRISILIDNKDIPNVNEGCHLPYVKATYTNKNSIVEFVEFTTYDMNRSLPDYIPDIPEVTLKEGGGYGGN